MEGSDIITMMLTVEQCTVYIMNNVEQVMNDIPVTNLLVKIQDKLLLCCSATNGDKNMLA